MEFDQAHLDPAVILCRSCARQLVKDYEKAMGICGDCVSGAEYTRITPIRRPKYGRERSR